MDVPFGMTSESFPLPPKIHDYHQVINIPKLSEEDTTLMVGNAASEKHTIPIPKGVQITIDAPGLHYNHERIHLVGNCYSD